MHHHQDEEDEEEGIQTKNYYCYVGEESGRRQAVEWLSALVVLGGPAFQCGWWLMASKRKLT